MTEAIMDTAGNGQRTFPRDAATKGLWAVIVFFISIILEFFNINFAMTILAGLVRLASIVLFLMALSKLSKVWQQKRLIVLGYILFISLVTLNSAEVVIQRKYADKYNKMFIESPEVIHADNANLILSELLSDIFFMLAFAFVKYLILAVLMFLIYKIISEISGISEFKIAGTIFLISAFLVPIVIGIFGLAIGLIFSIIAWSKARDLDIEVESPQQPKH